MFILGSAGSQEEEVDCGPSLRDQVLSPVAALRAQTSRDVREFLRESPSLSCKHLPQGARTGSHQLATPSRSDLRSRFLSAVASSLTGSEGTKGQESP